MTLQPCALVPVYNHPHTVGATVRKVLGYGLPVILVDDGCNDICRKVLDGLAADETRVHLVRLPENQGKGAAVKAGLYAARAWGFSHALQIDADGQHDPGDIPRFLATASAHPDDIIAGQPIYDQSVPKLRFYSRYLTHVWVWINTLSLMIKDSMCGFRVYPVAGACRFLDEERFGNRMDFETEILVRWYWRGGEVIQLRTRVHYPIDGISHFRGWADNWLLSKMHTRLFFGMLRRLPRLLLRPWLPTEARREP